MLVVTNAQESRRAFQQLVRTFREGAASERRAVGWQGGGGHYNMYVRMDVGLWGLFEPLDNRYWCCYGLAEHLEQQSSLSIVVEVNPPLEGTNRRCAGIFLRDPETDDVYLAHTGRLGGGFRGVRSNTFVAYRGDNFIEVTWPNGMQSSVLLIGRVDGERLPHHLAHFVREVERFKQEVRGGETPPSQWPTAGPGPTFAPEFSGRRRPYRLNQTIASQCDHGLVVDVLAAALAAHQLGNDRLRDLFILNADQAVCVLFEVKTDTSPSSLYSAVGQLLVNSAELSQRQRPLLYAVFPEALPVRTVTLLKRLGINVLKYTWSNNQPSFARAALRDVEGAI
jgi:hypothetical protein